MLFETAEVVEETVKEVAELGMTHYLPLIFVALPLLGGALVGKADWWRDLLVLAVVGWWLWFLIKSKSPTFSFQRASYSLGSLNVGISVHL